ncbi:MAG: DUF1490 domain-containing protein [Coriobacteriales bacterium]|nr:DUF1490 domain-containing protein [Coriobacteriales bacterium]
MLISRIALVAAGAVGAGLVGVASKSETVHDGVVKLAAACMRGADKISGAMQSVADEASDINVEARRQAKIDAAVNERLAALEDEIRAEVTAEIDGASAE